VQDAVGEKIGAVECEIRNVEVRWNNIKKCALATVKNLVEKVERRASRP
jgi:hypothetical protein